MKKVRVAILGYGHLGKWHCQKVEANKDVAEFVAIVEKFPSGQEAAKTNHPNVKVVSDIKDVINEIDAAFIVTPTSTHFELAKYLLENNKHVFCEKPVCSNDQEANELRKVATGKNVIFQVGQSERFHEAWDLLRKTFQNLPKPYTVRINRVAPFKGRATDVDVVQDLGIHDLDLINFLFPDKIQKIEATAQKIRTSNYDHVNIHARMENGSDAFVVLGRNHVKEIRELEVISKDGMILVDLFTNKILTAPKDKYEDGTFVKEESYNKRDHLLLEHQFSYDSIFNGKKSVVGFEDGAAAVHLVDSTLKAIATHSVVDVKF